MTLTDLGFANLRADIAQDQVAALKEENAKLKEALIWVLVNLDNFDDPPKHLVDIVEDASGIALNQKGM